MPSFFRFLTVAIACLLALAEAAPPGKCMMPGRAKAGKALYFLTNNKQNAVVALPIGMDGTLSEGTVTATGGMGSNSIDGATNETTGPDALVGQAALTIAGQYLFAVNAGSNTLSMMALSATNATQLTAVGEPVAIPGEFPNTVAASSKNSLVCVGSTGATAGISCSSFSAKGLTPMDCLRPFYLNQTTPPVGPTNTVSQAFFSGDESRLFTTVKGDLTKNNTGFFSVFPVTNEDGPSGASLASQDVRSSLDGTAVLFGSAIIPGTSNVFVTDASFGGAVLSVDSSTNKATVTAKQAISGQKSTCWAAFSQTSKSVFVTDVGVNHLVEMSTTDAKILNTAELSNGDPGLIDLRAAGDFVYALSPGNGTTSAAMTVFNAAANKQAQHFNLSQFGVNRNAQGLALLE